MISLIPFVSAETNFTYVSPYFNYNDQVGGLDYSHSNTTVELASSLNLGNSQPADIWILSGLIGLGLFLLSLRSRTSSMELEVDAIISVLAWAPIAFCSYASFAIDKMDAYGVTSQVAYAKVNSIQDHEYVMMTHHTIYSEPIIGFLMVIFLIVAIANTIRIISLHKSFKGVEDQS